MCRSHLRWATTHYPNPLPLPPPHNKNNHKTGSGGAYEISQRMTAMVGWAGTAEFREQWVFDGAAETYALDPEMAKKLAGALLLA